MPDFIFSSTAGTGWATGGNWTPAGPPSTSGDRAFFDSTATNRLAPSNQTATTLTEGHILDNFIQTIGDNGTPMQIGATKLYIHEPTNGSSAGQGSSRINLDLGTPASTIYVFGSSATGSDTGKEPIRIKAVNTSSVLNATGGRIGIATDSIGDVATFGTINVSGASVKVAPGITLTNLNISAGSVYLQSGCTTAAISSGGILTTFGTFLLTTLTQSAGSTVKMNHRPASGNAVTNLNLNDGALLDLSDTPIAIAFGTITPRGRVTIKRNAANRSQVSWTTLDLSNGDINFTS